MIDWPKVVQDLEAENAQLKKTLAAHQWVGLNTDEIIMLLCHQVFLSEFELVLAIEEKLKEKNT